MDSNQSKASLKRRLVLWSGTLRARLMLLSLTVLLPSLILSGLLFWNVDLQARRSLRAQLMETARALSLVLDRQLGEKSALLQTLAASSALREGDWAAFEQEARRATSAGGEWVVLFGPDGTQAINTRMAFGETLPRYRLGAADWAGKRGPVSVTNLVMSREGLAFVGLNLPVRLDDGRDVLLVVVTPVRDFARIFRDQGLPERWTASVADARFRLVSRSHGGERLIGRSASADMQAALARSDSGIIKTHTLDGVATESAYSRLPGYRWSVIVGVPRSDISAAAKGPLIWGAALALLLLGAGLILAAAAARTIAGPVSTLAAMARTWSERGAVEPPAPSGVHELDVLAQSLFDATTALQESDRRLQLALSASGAGVWDRNFAADDLTWSPEMFTLLGLEDGGSGHPPKSLFYDHLLPEDRGLVDMIMKRAVETMEPFSCDLRIRRADGEVRWLRSHGAVVPDSEGRAARVVGVNLDITDLRQKEEALEILNAQLADTVDSRTRERDRLWQLSRDPFLILDAEGRWLRVSPAWSEILGWSEDELVGRTADRILHPDDAEAWAAMVQRLTGGQVVTGFESRLRVKAGGYRRFSWMLAPYEALSYAVARDVTAEREAANELARAQDALRQSQKMDAIGQLTGGVAHDFNNLLTPILGSLDMIQRRAGLDERNQRLVDGALQSAERARALVQRLLAFARRQPLQPQAVDVAGLVRGMAALIGSTIGPRVRLVVEVADDLPKARGDQNQLEMALLNLAVNARDAMPDGGVLTIMAAAESVGESAADLKAGPYVRISVIDTGQGMSPETLARAIEPFFSTKGVGKGTGLGLSMAHGLAAQLGGAMRLASTPGVGTHIEFWLPEAATEAPVEEAGAAPQGAAGAGIVLLVDDEAVVRSTTAAMLQELGYSVVEAASAGEALQLLDGGLKPTVLVTDHLMPEMTGAELAAAVRARACAPPILIISGYTETDSLVADLPRLTKPFRQADLAARLTELTAEQGSS